VTSGGTNVLAFASPDGLVLVDSGAPDRSDALMASLQALTPGQGASTLFNTHWHAENTGANQIFRQNGAAIVAHENTRLWMATPTWMPDEDRYRPPRTKEAQPDKTFYADGAMTCRERAHRVWISHRSAHQRRHLRLLPRRQRARRWRRRIAGARPRAGYLTAPGLAAASMRWTGC
jgi:hypothetical protein